MRSTVILNGFTLLATFIVAPVALGNVVFADPVNRGHGQKTYAVTGPANQNYNYTESNPGQDDATRPGKLNAAGVGELWVAKNTTLSAPVKKPDAPNVQAMDGAFFSPGGDTTLDYTYSDTTVTMTDITIDSGFFQIGPGAGGPDPLFGAVLHITPLDNYVGHRDPEITTFGAIFGRFGGASLSITKDSSTLLTASFAYISNDPGETDFFAVLTETLISNSINSEMLSVLDSAVAGGRDLLFEILPDENLAGVATQGTATGGGTASYYEDGSVTGRAGIGVAVPEPGTLALLALTGLRLTRRRR